MVDREKVINQFEADVKRAERTGEMFVYVGRKTAKDAIALLKEKEVKQGRWKSVQYKKARICSVCEKDEPYKFADDDSDVYDFCPHCGAKMTDRR